MAKILGLQCRTYQNTDYDQDDASNTTAYADSAWTLRQEVTSVNVDGTAATADVSSRAGGGYRQKVATLKEGTVSFDLIYDSSDSSFFNAIDVAYRNGDVLDLIFCNGSLGSLTAGVVTSSTTAEDGVRGFRAGFVVSNFSETQELEDAQRFSVTLEVSASIPTPGYYVKGGGASPTLALVS